MALARIESTVSGRASAPSAAPARGDVPRAGVLPEQLIRSAPAARGNIAILPTYRDNEASPADVVGGMLDDYYNRVVAIPSTLEVQNPGIGQPQPYSIWNAYLSSNIVTSRADTDTTGLTNTATVGQSFRALQLRPFSVTVGPTAPVQVGATYRFNFTVGVMTFRFIASLAVALDIAPEMPSEQILEYQTDLFRARDGTEQRMAVRGNAPRQTYSYDLILTSDAQRRQLRLDQFTNNLAPLVLPIWHEPFPISAAVSAGGTVLTADLAFSDVLIGENVFIETPNGELSELGVVSAQTASEMTLRNGLINPYPAGSAIYPTVIIQPDDRGTVRYFAVNASRRAVRGVQRGTRALGGAGATIAMHESLPVLESNPLANELVTETFSRTAEAIDFGGVRQLYSGATFSNMARQLEFQVGTRADLQYWKLFLDTIYGRREPFLFATYQPDVIPFSHTAGTNQITIRNTPNLNNYLASAGHNDLRLELTPGNRVEYRRVTDSQDNDDGTLTLVLNTALPDLGANTAVSFISLLERCRLGADRVTFRHYSTYSTVTLSVETVEI